LISKYNAPPDLRAEEAYSKVISNRFLTNRNLFTVH
jgi:hypothetical protein